MSYKLTFLLLFISYADGINGQLCTNTTQTPSSALLVCGSSSFVQSTSQFCGQKEIPVPCPGGFTYQNSNPHFFRMACFAGGTLGFTIVPNDPYANFDWQLFDITNTNPDDIFTNPGLFVACNWSSELGETGATIDGSSLIVCGGSGQPVFSKMPVIQASRTYMLMVLNQSASGEPYVLTFAGGTSSITDATEPHLWKGRVSCDGTEIIVRLNKQILCTSLALDGSDFLISGGANIIAAERGTCSSNLESDSMMLKLDRRLINGTYTLTLRKGVDGNTLIDICNRSIPEGEFIPIEVLDLQPTPMDSVNVTPCKPSYIDLYFRKPMQCNTIAVDGSDFVVNGPQAVQVSGVTTNCSSNAVSPHIRLNLSAPIGLGGDYEVRLSTGTDGNSIADECGLFTAAGSVVPFMIRDSVSALFSFEANPSCDQNIISFLHDGNNVNSWQWNVGIPYSGNIPNPVISYPGPVNHNVSLTVSNGYCSASHIQKIEIDNRLKADFEVPSIICPGQSPSIINRSSGKIDYWEWDFGNGNNSNAEQPGRQVFMPGNTEQQYTISLIIANSISNCRDTVLKTIRVPANCILGLPKAFTPNNDGLNDYFYPINADKIRNLKFEVYNRYGQAVFLTNDPNKKWDGKLNGHPQPAGVYAWILSYSEPASNEKVIMKGTVVLIR